MQICKRDRAQKNRPALGTQTAFSPTTTRNHSSDPPVVVGLNGDTHKRTAVGGRIRRFEPQQKVEVPLREFGELLLHRALHRNRGAPRSTPLCSATTHWGAVRSVYVPLVADASSPLCLRPEVPRSTGASEQPVQVTQPTPTGARRRSHAQPARPSWPHGSATALALTRVPARRLRDCVPGHVRF